MIARAVTFHICEDCAHIIWPFQRAETWNWAEGLSLPALMAWRCLVCALRKRVGKGE